MKVYIARIYCPYEGSTYACGIFSTREKAEQACPWFTDNAEYWRKQHLRAFEVHEQEIDSNEEFEILLQGSLGYLKFLADETDEPYEHEDKPAMLEMYNKLKHLHKEEPQE